MSTRSVTAPFVGRDRQLADLDGLVADVVAGRGGAVWVEGEAGIGKSALLDAALGTVEQRGCQVFRGVAHELMQRFPLQVLLECLQVSEASQDPLRAQIASMLRARGSEVGAGDPVVPASEGLLALVDRLCASAPVVLVVDDLQWADEPSLAVWYRLAHSVSQLPLLLVGACRPVGRRDPLSGLRRSLKSQDAAILALGPLSSREAAQVMSCLLGGAPGPGLRELAERAGGNPLYLREIADAVVREERATVTGGMVEVVTGTRGAFASLSAAIADRLEFLTGDTAEALQVAALLGPEFAAADLAVVTGRSATSLIPIVEEGVASGVLAESGTRLVFRHSLIRDALAAEIPPGLRTALHLQAAQALIASRASTERVAEQLLAATDSRAVTDGWVIDWLVEAGPQLVYRAPTIAADLLAQTVDTISSTHPHYEELGAQLVTAAWLDGRDAEVERRARQILAGDPAPMRKAQVAWMLSYVHCRFGRSDEAIAVVLDALADHRLDAAWTARLRALHVIPLMIASRNDEADHVAQVALAEAEKAGDLVATGYALHGLAGVRLRDPNKSGALEYLDRAVGLVPASPDTMDLRLLLLLNRSAALQEVDRLTEALHDIREASQLAEQGGTRMRRAELRIMLGELLYMTGQWDDTIAELENVDALYPLFRLFPDGLRALIAAHRDDRAGVDKLLATYTDDSFGPGDLRYYSTPLIRARALVAERDGHTGRATELLAAALAPDWESEIFVRSIWLPDLARLATSSGDAATARAALAAAESDATTAPTPSRIAAAERCRGLIDQNPELLHAAADRYRAVGRPLELANTLEDAAVVLAQRGDADAARAALDEALTHYGDLGADFDIRRANAHLRPYGMRRGQRGARRRPTTGWEALTPTELRVAELVADGGSNPDIAVAMFLSRRTVQTHVSHILTKLGARSRIEIAHQAAKHLLNATPANPHEQLLRHSPG